MRTVLGVDSGDEAGRSTNAGLAIGTPLILCPKAHTGHATQNNNGGVVFKPLLFAPKGQTVMLLGFILRQVGMTK